MQVISLHYCIIFPGKSQKCHAKLLIHHNNVTYLNVVISILLWATVTSKVTWSILVVIIITSDRHSWRVVRGPHKCVNQWRELWVVWRLPVYVMWRHLEGRPSLRNFNFEDDIRCEERSSINFHACQWVSIIHRGRVDFIIFQTIMHWYWNSYKEQRTTIDDFMAGRVSRY